MKLTRVSPTELRSHGIRFLRQLRDLEEELEELLSKHGYAIAYHYEIETLSIDEDDVEFIEKELGLKPVLAIPLIKTKEPYDGIYRAIVLENSEIVLVRTQLTSDGVAKKLIRLE